MTVKRLSVATVTWLFLACLSWSSLDINVSWSWILAVRMASSCIACCIFHIIPFNYSDTALRVAEAMIGAKVIILVFHHVCCFPNLAPELVPRVFGRISSRKPGRNFSYESKGKFVPVTWPDQATGFMWRGPKCNASYNSTHSIP